MDLFGQSRAEFSPDRIYRYALYRMWGKSKHVMFIGLNPSTADETKDDPTVRRCINYAADWGYSGLIMANLFALRATDPMVMMSHDAPIGPENDQFLRRLADKASLIIAAWGIHGSHMGRDKEVLSFIPDMMCLGVTDNGSPRHPLYMKANTKPRRM